MDFTSLLKTVAPWIGTAVGGPLGGIAVEAVTKALGISDKTSEGLKNALAGMTPADQIALQKAEQDFKTTAMAMGYKQITDLTTLEINDRKDARAMQVDNHSNVPAILTVVLTIGFFVVLIARMFNILPSADDPIVNQMIGSLLTGWAGSLAYWLGTTHNSFAKTQMIANSTPN